MIAGLMRSTYAQWLKYAAYTLLITTVVVGGYYFVYVQQHAEQLANDRLAMLHESSGSFAEELGRVKRNLVNTLQDDAKTATPDTLASARRELSDIAHVYVQEWETGRNGKPGPRAMISWTRRTSSTTIMLRSTPRSNPR